MVDDGTALAARVAVIGAGAIGGVAAACLSKAGHRVTLCVRTPIRQFHVEHGGDVRAVEATIVTDPAMAGVQDWIFVATKTQDTASVKPWLDAMTGPGTVIVLLQNGVDGMDILRPLAGSVEIIPSIVYISAERVRRDLVRYFFGNRLEVPEGKSAVALQALFAGCAIEVRTQADFITAAWRKLIGNVALNPITALTMQRFGVFRDPAIRDLSAQIIREAAQVANAAGAHFTLETIEEIVEYCGKLSPQGGTSMLYDRIAGNRLEYEHLTGTIVRLGEQHGIGVPFNKAIYALLGALDASLVQKSVPVPPAAANDQAEKVMAL